jgi:hypothetical protein
LLAILVILTIFGLGMVAVVDPGFEGVFTVIFCDIFGAGLIGSFLAAPPCALTSVRLAKAKAAAAAIRISFFIYLPCDSGNG